VLSFSNQKNLSAIHSTHWTTGINVVDNRRLRVTLNAYEKRYRDYPVAVLFPQLTMANIADTFGEAFLMFPMTSKGSGVTRGVESSIDFRPTSRITLASTVTYMRSWFSGLDGVLHKGNFDIPVVANFSGYAQLSKGWAASFRYSASTGKPYTPDDPELSYQQDRDVYDLTKLNSVRAPTYSRLDFRWEWTHPVHRGLLKVHFGLENAMGTTNFYELLWRPHCPDCGVLQQNQMPTFPDFGINFSR
jgi:TonB dependent receptor